MQPSINRYQRPEEKNCGWRLLLDAPYRMGVEHLKEAGRTGSVAQAVLGGMELLPGFNIPIAMLDRAHVQGKYLFPPDPIETHVAYECIFWWSRCIDTKDPKED